MQLVRSNASGLAALTALSALLAETSPGSDTAQGAPLAKEGVARN